MRKIITVASATALAALALAGTASVPAVAVPAHHRVVVLCDRSGRGPCLTVRYWHRGSALRAGHGTPVRIAQAGHVGRSWPFRRSPWLDRQMRGIRLVQIHVGRSCAGTSALGAVRLMRCSRASLWAPGLPGPRALVSVRASDAAGVPCLLTAVQRSRPLWAVISIGFAVNKQKWAHARRAS